MRKGRNYIVYTEDGWRTASREEWTASVKTGKRADIIQILGGFGTDGDLLQVCTGLSNRRNRPPGEWESRVLDGVCIDLVNPSYCPGKSIQEIEAMHGKALSKARAFIRNYVERVPHYSWNLLGEEGSDPRYLAKTIDFAVDYFEEWED